MTRDEAVRRAAQLIAAGETTRIQLLDLLGSQDNLDPGALAAMLGLPRAALDRHLADLARAGLTEVYSPAIRLTHHGRALLRVVRTLTPVADRARDAATSTVGMP